MDRDATAGLQQRFADSQRRDGWLRAEQPEEAPECIKCKVVEPLAEFSRMVGGARRDQTLKVRLR